MGARMKKGVAQKIATSKGGKSAAKKVLNAEVMGLLNALKITIECYAGKERAEEMENNMIRIITKVRGTGSDPLFLSFKCACVPAVLCGGYQASAHSGAASGGQVLA